MAQMLVGFARALAQELPPPLAGDFLSDRRALPFGGAPSDGLGASPAPLPVAMQVCLPAPLWDWPTDHLGTSSDALYEFCSWVPERSSEWGAFEPSVQRLSDAYALFLSALPPSPQTSSAWDALKAPANQTQVAYPNGPMMMPAWIVTQDAASFVASVAGRTGLGSTIRVDLSGSDDQSGSGRTLFSVSKGVVSDLPVRLGAGEVRQLELHADAWGNVPVRPGAWFNGALVGAYSGGPFTGDWTSDKFFGRNGILRGMMTGLLVGLNVSVVATMSETAAAAVQSAAPAGSAIWVAGLGFAAEGMDVAEGGGARRVSLPSTAAVSSTGQSIGAQTPVIVGVEVRALGKIDV